MMARWHMLYIAYAHKFVPVICDPTFSPAQSLLLLGGARTILRLEASTPLETLLTASRGRKGFLYNHSPPSTTIVAPVHTTHRFSAEYLSLCILKIFERV